MLVGHDIWHDHFLYYLHLTDGGLLKPKYNPQPTLYMDCV